jgi:sigma-B regulation protein RsbU (phosphoserine phosphatase)
MTEDEPRHEAPPRRDNTLSQTILDDLRTSNLDVTLRQDLQAIYQFYLDEEEQAHLATMNQAQRWVWAAGWLLKNMFLRLPPPRRVLLLAGLMFFVAGLMGPGFWFALGSLSLLVGLFLELKDKLLAQDELETGRAVQLALMPDRTPAFPGWELWLYTRPANEVGGDLIDYLRLSDDHMGIALGDVAGKGLGAALFMANLQATLRALAPSHPSLASLGAEVNQIFCRDGLPNRFASLVYLVLEADGGRVRLLNAGHHPPLLVRGSTTSELPRGTLALGLSPKALYEEQQFDLDPGDLLLVYSDGLTEARNEYGAFFGEERLNDLLCRMKGRSAQTAGQLLLRALDQFVGHAPTHDDLSLVVLRRKPGG